MSSMNDMMIGWLVIAAVTFLYVGKIIASPLLFISLAFSDVWVFVTVALIITVFTGSYYERLMGPLGLMVTSYYRIWGCFLGMVYTVFVMS